MTGPAVLPQLFGQHLDRVWADDRGDVWMADPNTVGRWRCYRPSTGAVAAGLIFPLRCFGPYTEQIVP